MEKPSPLGTAALWCCRLLLGGAFGTAAVLKIMDPSAFVADIGHYRLLPYPVAVVLAVYLPWLELLCGAAVLIRWRDRGALLLLVALCAVFSLALASAWLRGLNIDCGCFGRVLASSLPVALARSLILGGIGVFLLLGGNHPESETVRTGSVPES